MDNENSLASGGMTMLILKLLSEKDMYGYEMIDTLRKRTQNVFEHKAGTLYPLLHSIEDRNFVKGYEQEQLSKTRKYYRLTRLGKKKLTQKPKKWDKLHRTICEFIVWGI